VTATYLDTSVILARYIPSDPSFHSVENFFKRMSEPRYISEISILELYCVFSRLINGASLSALDGVRGFGQLTIDEKVRVAVEHAVRTWRVKVMVPERTFVRLPLSKQTFEIAHELFEAIRSSPVVGLKTLDALHVAYAHSIRELVPDLNTFTTLDKDILSKSEAIQKETDIRVVTILAGE
jgi:predicted nucleic acid-binding protein